MTEWNEFCECLPNSCEWRKFTCEYIPNSPRGRLSRIKPDFHTRFGTKNHLPGNKLIQHSTMAEPASSQRGWTNWNAWATSRVSFCFQFRDLLRQIYGMDFEFFIFGAICFSLIETFMFIMQKGMGHYKRPGLAMFIWHLMIGILNEWFRAELKNRHVWLGNDVILYNLPERYFVDFSRLWCNNIINWGQWRKGG